MPLPTFVFISDCRLGRSSTVSRSQAFLMGVRLLGSHNLVAFLVFLRPKVGLHGHIGDEVASTGDAVVLSEAWLLLVMLLVQKLFGLFG